MQGEGKIPEVDEEVALKMIKEGLLGEDKAYVYHCRDHYCCPMGFEATPKNPFDAYDFQIGVNGKEGEDLEHWLLIGEIEQCFPPFHVRKWADVVKDLNMQNPQFMDIRRPEKGVMEHKGLEFTEGWRKGGNIHCFMEFSKN
jgi:hypothetical protein